MQSTDTKPNGPVAASFLAAGIGSLTLGLTVTLAAASTDIKNALDFAKNYGIGNGVGPLSGKVVVSIASFGISWVIIHVMLRGREVTFSRVFVATMILVGLGFALTFPPIFDLFAPKG